MIRIEKDRILYTDLSDEQHEIYPAELPAHLGDVVELGELVTFARVFDLIVDNRDLFNTIFAAELGNYKIEQYLEEYNQAAAFTHDHYDLEVHPICQVHDDPEYPAFEYYLSFHGVGILAGDTEAEGPYPIGLSFTSLHELKHKYIRINNAVQIYTYSEESSIGQSAVYEGEIKLFDFFGAILNEISFFGDPDYRDQVSDEISESAEAVDRGDEEFFSLEEVREQSEKVIREAEEEEDRRRKETVKEQIASGYIRDFIDSTFQEAIEKLEELEQDLVSLERYEDAKGVRGKIDKLKSSS